MSRHLERRFNPKKLIIDNIIRGDIEYFFEEDSIVLCDSLALHVNLTIVERVTLEVILPSLLTANLIRDGLKCFFLLVYKNY